MTDKHPSWQQNAQQRNREGGRYAKGPACYACGKPAGHNYISHGMTDCKGPDGQGWGDTALVLCKKCAIATESMQNVGEFKAFAASLHREGSRKS